jgi:hypothetical protein
VPCVIQGRPRLGRAGCGSRHSWLRTPHGANPTSGSGRHALSLINCKHFTIPEAGVKITPLGPGSGRKVVVSPAFDETTVWRWARAPEHRRGPSQPEDTAAASLRCQPPGGVTPCCAPARDIGLQRSAHCAEKGFYSRELLFETKHPWAPPSKEKKERK